MDKKDILGELKVQLDNGKEDVISNIISRNGYSTLINFIEKEIDRDREEEREKVLMIVSVVLMANFGNGANELMQIIKSKLTK